MTCRRHPFEDGIGVCAFCLRERLLVLLAAAAESSPDHSLRTNPEPEPDPPSPEPLPFPRSASPHITRIQSEASAATILQSRSFGVPDIDGRRHRHGKFPILSALFGHSRSEGRAREPAATNSPRSSSSWFSALIHGGKRKKKKLARLFSADDAAAAAERRHRRRGRKDRGMSPEGRRSEPESGYDTESPGALRRPEISPMRRPTPEHQHLGRGLAGFAVCLSPFMMTSPARRRSQLAEILYSGENPRVLSPHHRRHASGGGGPSLGPSRFRNLVRSSKFW